MTKATSLDSRVPLSRHTDFPYRPLWGDTVLASSALMRTDVGCWGEPRHFSDSAGRPPDQEPQMIGRIKYRSAVRCAIASSEAPEKQNRARITKEEEFFSEYRRSKVDKGPNEHNSPAIQGAKSRRDAVVGSLEGQILKGKRDIAEAYIQYLLREADALGVLLPATDETEMWLPRRVDYYNHPMILGR